MNIPQINLPRIVIIGCGFAGLKFCKKINTNKYQVVLIDKKIKDFIYNDRGTMATIGQK